MDILISLTLVCIGLIAFGYVRGQYIYSLFGILMLAATVFVGAAYVHDEMSAIYQAAQTQNLQVRVSFWELQPSAMPCEVDLTVLPKGDGNHALLVETTNTIATTEVLEALCE